MNTDQNLKRVILGYTKNKSKPELNRSRNAFCFILIRVYPR
jgi:hypothetical protein